jgi:hypothetical protein
MSLMLDDLPRDPDRLLQHLRRMAEVVTAQSARIATLEIERDTVLAERDVVRTERDLVREEHEAAQAEIQKLRLLIRQLQRGQFGRRSERLDPDQLQLGLEDLEQTAAAPRRRRRRWPRGTAPLGRPGSGGATWAPCRRTCRGSRSWSTSRTRAAPAAAAPARDRRGHERDARHRPGPAAGEGDPPTRATPAGPARRRWCRHPHPERPITGGMATEALLAHGAGGQVRDFLPLYRQAQIFARQGIELDRSTLCDWVGRACWWLEPLWRLLRRHVTGSTRIFADDTRLPVLDPGRGRTKTGCLWGYAVDDRPWGGETPPAVVFLYAEDRKGERPAAHLAGFEGILQVDGYSGFKSLLAGRPPDQIKLAFCWAHCRRGFYELHRSTGSPLAEEALRRIGELYAIEAEIRGRPAEVRRAVRQERSKPIVEALHAWLTIQLGRVSGRSTLAEALRYALRHWTGLVLFLEDGRLELDTNTVERAIRPIALGRKNSLFAGSDGGARHWAIVASLIGDRRAQRGGALGVAHRRARARGLGTDQGPRARATAALELEG